MMNTPTPATRPTLPQAVIRERALRAFSSQGWPPEAAAELADLAAATPTPELLAALQ